MPRAGTTLVEQILASHPDIHGCGEIYDLNEVSQDLFEKLIAAKTPDEAVGALKRSEIKQAAKLYIDRIRQPAQKAQRIINKTPHNFELLGIIASLFTNAKIIHCVRDPRDTCLSCFTHMFKSAHGYNADIAKLGAYYLQYKRLMRHWRQVLPLPIFDIHYEDLVDNQEEQSRALISFLGLDWDEKCLSFHETERVVLTPSRWQVRQPLYRSAIGRWRNYQNHIAPLEALLKEADF